MLTWCCCSKGYACTNVDKITKRWHQLFLNYDDDLVADHINNRTYDNRNDNLRVVTIADSMRNRTKQHNNTSGKQGVSRYMISGRNYWCAEIFDKSHKTIKKVFSIAKLGDDEAKRQAIEKRKELEIQIWIYRGLN